jgi:hypothetical protein
MQGTTWAWRTRLSLKPRANLAEGQPFKLIKKMRTRRFYSLVLMGISITPFSLSVPSQNAPANSQLPEAVHPIPDPAPEIIILTGNPMGGVEFRHRLHTQIREIQCSTCHHESRPQKPLTAAYQPCRSCHTEPASAPMSTNTEAAFHNPGATAGLCITCHKTEDTEHKHKLAPVTCQECHNPANVLPEPTAGK